MKDDFILLEEREGNHSTGIGYYYRPIGGTIEFGEKSQQTLMREFKEELGTEIVISRYISCLENIFTIGTTIGHEITQIYLARFKDEEFYHHESYTVTEGNRKSLAKWIPKEELVSGEKVLYPNGLNELLRELF